jgi:UPF0716 protein FxsA
MRFFLLPILLLWPLAEIAGFVLVGRALGLWATLGLVVGTAILGAILLRSQGMQILKQISAESRDGRMPGRTLVDGAMIVVAGILLLLPGFLTDLIGLALFIPFVRSFLWSLVGKRIVVIRTRTTSHYEGSRTGPAGQKPGPVVDLDEEDFHRDDNSANSGSTSPWAGPKSREP